MINGVRQFKLINGLGAEYDMTRPEALFHDPNGLGWGTEREIVRLGMTYTAIDEREIHSAPSGEMVFRTYREYANFLAFIQVGGLVLAYKPINTWYYAQCIRAMDKSEIKPSNNHLVCPITFETTSYWYEKVIQQTSTTVITENAKTYDYAYDYQYSINASNTFDLMLDLPSYFKITIFGEATNPVWTLSVNGSAVMSGKVSTTVPVGQKLIVNTDPNEMEIGLYNASTGAFISNQYGNSDFTTERIFSLPRGASTIAVTTDDLTVPQVALEVMKHV